MKRLLLILLLLLISTSTAFAGIVMAGTQLGALDPESPVVDECLDKLVCQNFEDSGYDNSESWTEGVGTGGTVDEDDTTATVLRDSQQLKIYAGDSGSTSYAYASFTEQSELWFHVLVKFPDGTPSNSTYFLALSDGSTTKAWISLLTTGAIRVYHGSTVYAVGGSTPPLFANDTAYHIWGYYKASDAGMNNGKMTVWVGTSTTRPEAAEASVVVGTEEASVTRIMLQEKYQGTAYFDQVIVSNTSFTTVSE
jgi:hypothetical protein